MTRVGTTVGVEGIISHDSVTKKPRRKAGALPLGESLTWQAHTRGFRSVGEDQLNDLHQELDGGEDAREDADPGQYLFRV